MVLQSNSNVSVFDWSACVLECALKLRRLLPLQHPEVWGSSPEVLPLPSGKLMRFLFGEHCSVSVAVINVASLNRISSFWSSGGASPVRKWQRSVRCSNEQIFRLLSLFEPLPPLVLRS